MNALEFSGRIEKGIIRLPEGYEQYDNSYARIIVLVEPPAEQANKKERLRSVLKRMEQVNMFTTIHEPVSWQKQIRDEWE